MSDSDSDYEDMPALLCGRCNRVASKGGSKWEKKNKSTHFCNCSGDTTHDDKINLQFLGG